MDKDLEQFIKNQMVLHPRTRMCYTTGISECQAYKDGMEWLMGALVASDQNEVDNKKSQLQA